MPRELAHAYIAEAALSQTESLGKTILNDLSLRAAFFLGTASPDSGYYCKSLLIKGDVISDIFHSKNIDNSYYLYNKLISNFKSNKLIEAFCLGCISHILLDSYWHPYIFKVSGDYYDKDLDSRSKARARHRRIESLIDNILALELSQNFTDHLLYENIRLLDDNTFELSKLISQVINLDKKTMQRCWKWHSILQTVLLNKFIGSQAEYVPVKQEFRALTIYSPKKKHTEYLKKSIKEKLSIDIQELCKSSTNQMSSVFKAYEADSNYFLKVMGSSPNTGELTKHFYNGPFEIDDKFLDGY